MDLSWKSGMCMWAHGVPSMLVVISSEPYQFWVVIPCRSVNYLGWGFFVVLGVTVFLSKDTLWSHWHCDSWCCRLQLVRIWHTGFRNFNRRGGNTVTTLTRQKGTAELPLRQVTCPRVLLPKITLVGLKFEWKQNMCFYSVSVNRCKA